MAGKVGIKSYDSKDILSTDKCDLKIVSEISSLMALVGCHSNEQFLNICYHWKPNSYFPFTNYYNLIMIITITIIVLIMLKLSWLAFLRFKKF